MRWSVSGCSETEQSDVVRCQSIEQIGLSSEERSRDGHCSVICYADAVFVNAEGKSQCGLVVGPHSLS